MSNDLTHAGGEIAQIEQTMRTSPGEYWGNPGLQERYQRLLEAKTGSTDPVVASTIAAIRADIGEDHWPAFEKGFEALPDNVHFAIHDALSAGAYTFVRPAGETALAKWRGDTALGPLVAEWGGRAALKVAAAATKAGQILEVLNDDDAEAVLGWFERLSPHDARVVARHLAG